MQQAGALVSLGLLVDSCPNTTCREMRSHGQAECFKLGGMPRSGIQLIGAVETSVEP